MIRTGRHLSEEALSGGDSMVRERDNMGRTWVDGVARRESENQCLDREPLKGVVKKEAPVAAAAAAMVVEFDGGGDA